MAALLCAVVDVDLQAVGAGVSDELQRHAAAPRRDRPGRLPGLVESATLRASKGRSPKRAVEPGEHVVERDPEALERCERLRQLVPEHVGPLGLDLATKRRRPDRLRGGDLDPGVLTLVCKHVPDGVSLPDQVRMPMHVNDVVEIARATAFGQCAQLLAKELSDRVTGNASHWKSIGVWMPDGSKDRLVDQQLVCGEVQLHLRHCGVGVRAAVGDPALCGWLASPVLPSPKRLVVQHKLNAGFFADPFRDLGEDPHEVGRFLRPTVHDREVQILGESERLVVALPQARPALEDPAPAQLLVVGDSGQEPAQHVVLLDHILVDEPLGSQIGKLTLSDHEAPSRATVALISRPHRMTRCPPRGASGSSKEMPDDTRSAHAASSAP